MTSRRTLYESSGYDDNYTDASFLKDLRTNLNVRQFTFYDAFAGVARLNSQFSCLIGFLVIFVTMYNDRVPPTSVLMPSLLSSIIGYLIFNIDKKQQFQRILEDIKTLVTVFIFGYLFAPLLHTLTGANSTDTIFVVTFLVMLINIISQDYGLSLAVMPSAVSITAAIFGAICLASRLPTSYHAFVLLVVSVIFFVIYPMLTALLWHPVHSILLSVLCAYMLYKFSFVIYIAYLTIVICLFFIVPLIFVDVQRYKNNIHGPWDEAMVAQPQEVND